MKKIIIAQFSVLLAGTLFAWINLGVETYDYLNQRACSLGCTAGEVVNPVFTPCFYGACFFLISFVLSAVLLRKMSAENKVCQ